MQVVSTYRSVFCSCHEALDSLKEEIRTGSLALPYLRNMEGAIRLSGCVEGEKIGIVAEASRQYRKALEEAAETAAHGLSVEVEKDGGKESEAFWEMMTQVGVLWELCMKFDSSLL